MKDLYNRALRTSQTGGDGKLNFRQAERPMPGTSNGKGTEYTEYRFKTEAYVSTLDPRGKGGGILRATVTEAKDMDDDEVTNLEAGHVFVIDLWVRKDATSRRPGFHQAGLSPAVCVADGGQTMRPVRELAFPLVAPSSPNPEPLQQFLEEQLLEVIEVQIVKILDQYGLEVAIPSLNDYVMISRGKSRFVDGVRILNAELRSSAELLSELQKSEGGEPCLTKSKTSNEETGAVHVTSPTSIMETCADTLSTSPSQASFYTKYHSYDQEEVESYSCQFFVWRSSVNSDLQNGYKNGAPLRSR